MSWAGRIVSLISGYGCLFGSVFFDSNEKGPPWGTNTAELSALLSPHFELIAESAPTDSIAVFAGRERWQVWRRAVAT